MKHTIRNFLIDLLGVVCLVTICTSIPYFLLGMGAW